MGSPEVGVRILWAICAGFLLGVFARSLIALPVGAALFAAFLGLACFIASRGIPDKRHWGMLIGITLLAFTLGVVRMNAAVLKDEPVLNARIGQKVELDGVVADEPDARDSSVRVHVRALSLASSTQALKGDIIAILPAQTQIYYGERVRIAGLLQTPRSFDAGAGREFNYPGYLAAQGIGYELDRATLLKGEGFSGNPLTASAYRAKETFVAGLERALPEPQSGLAGGITVGDKRSLGKDLTQEFRTVSLVHIIVLSGYNISIVIKYLFDVLTFLRVPRYIRFGSGVFVALFFAVMTGFASASLRAALMALIAITGQLSNRVYRPERALALVALLMVFWNPYLLVFDPGFQLSFFATAGLMAFSPHYARWFAWVPTQLTLREILVATLSAQTAVLPLLLYESGNLSLVAIPANLLVLAVVPPAMLLSSLAALGGLLTPFIAPVIGLPAYILLSYVLDIAHVLARVPFAAITIPAFSAWLLLPAYVALFGYAFSSTLHTSAAPQSGAAQGKS